MKRSAALVRFSREHHPALVMAKRLRSAGDDPTALSQLADAFNASFAAELEPHFCAEEARLLPLLAAAGETALVDRTRREHAEMRALAAEIRRGTAGSLRPLGQLLEAHVRFEERELFAVAEAVLSAAALDDILRHAADAGGQGGENGPENPAERRIR